MDLESINENTCENEHLFNSHQNKPHSQNIQNLNEKKDNNELDEIQSNSTNHTSDLNSSHIDIEETSENQQLAEETFIGPMTEEQYNQQIQEQDAQQNQPEIDEQEENYDGLIRVIHIAHQARLLYEALHLINHIQEHQQQQEQENQEQQQNQINEGQENQENQQESQNNNSSNQIQTESENNIPDEQTQSQNNEQTETNENTQETNSQQHEHIIRQTLIIFEPLLNRYVVINIPLTVNREQKGATEEDLNKLKYFQVDENYLIQLENEDKSNQCSICLEQYKNGDDLCKLRCQHTYHKECIQKWLKQVNKCPFCKRECNQETN